jgi:hypothetical protein
LEGIGTSHPGQLPDTLGCLFAVIGARGEWNREAHLENVTTLITGDEAPISIYEMVEPMIRGSRNQ